MLHVYFHTNRPLRPPPNGSGFLATSGWSASPRLPRLRAEWACCIRAPWNLPQAFKYRWMLEQAERAAGARSAWLGLLSDGDVVFQCTAAEIMSRFARLGTPLVVGAERRWFPLPRDAADPFGPPANLSWREKYTLRRQRQFYPNSGLLLGTASGFRMLLRELERIPRFPCCAYHGESGGFQLDPCSSCRPPRAFPDPVPCVVDDQACLHVALAGARGSRQFVVDSEGKLFLNLHDLLPHELVARDGRVAFKKSAETPCVVHGNGGKDALLDLLPRAAGKRQGRHTKGSMISRDVVSWAPFL
ncbi:hypothetical protein AB1Y20_019632 [Prymnesium parvum]|uniref:Protein xylosyltransferase n=1 Tax=Prymnesium parvum TaxID=97485 RepID=A0AB34JSV8_PRYPA